MLMELVPQNLVNYSVISTKMVTKILLENVDLTANCDPKSYLDPQTFYNMTELLDTYVEYWSQCDIIIIEKQMSFGKKHNTMALKLGQHCWSYFSIKYPTLQDC